MNKYLRSILPTLAIVFLFSAGASTVSAQDVLRQILKRMDDHNKALVSLKANVKMNKLNVQLGENDLYEGSISYLPGRSQKQIYVRIDWKSPVVEHLSIANGEYRLFNPKQNQMIVGKVENAQKNAGAGNALAFMSMNKAQLSQNYTVRYMGDETVSGGVKAFHLELTPKNAAAGYKSADLWVDANGMPIQSKIVERNNDSTTILLYNLQKNATVKASLFRIDPPRGTKVIRG
jgi:outer membrane lipoprotein-sorting protein